jgi:hypothetical protein
MKYIKCYSLFEQELGWKEMITIEGLGEFAAKLDTGNGSKASSLGVNSLEITGDSVRWSCNGEDRVDRIVDWSYAKVGHSLDKRPVITMEIEIGGVQMNNVPIALTDRSDKETPVLLNREVLSELGVVVSPQHQFTLKNKIASK